MRTPVAVGKRGCSKRRTVSVDFQRRRKSQLHPGKKKVQSTVGALPGSLSSELRPRSIALS